MAWEVPQLNYSNASFDGSQLSGLGDALVGALNERGAKSALTKYANSLYGASPPEPQSLGARLLSLAAPQGPQQTPNDPVNARINQGFDVAGQERTMPVNDRIAQGFGDQPNYSADLGLAPEQYRSAYADAGQKYGVDPTLLVRQGKQESGFDPNAVSPAGAKGISQFMPATAEQYGIDPSNAGQSIDAQGHMMSDVSKKFGGNTGLALMAYNWGQGNVQEWLDSGADPANVPRETQDYVEQVSGKPVEAWLNGADGGTPSEAANPQTVAQPAMPEVAQAPNDLPDRATLTAMLRNPITRSFAADIIKAARTSKNWQKLSDNTLFDPVSGETRSVKGGKREIRNDANGVPRFTDTGEAVYPSDQSASGGTQFFSGRSVQAQGLNYLIDQGRLTKEQAANVAAGKTVVGPNGEQIFMTPEGIMAIPGAAQSSGGNVLTGPKASEDMRKAKGFALRADAADKIIADPKIAVAGQSLQEKTTAGIPGVGNYTVSPEYRQFDQAQRNFINAVLRRESGAAINESEWDNGRKQYFPQPGDDAGTLKQKAENRKLAIQSLNDSAEPVPTFGGTGQNQEHIPTYNPSTGGFE